MAADEVRVTEVAADETVNDMLEAAAHGNPWVFVYAYDLPGDGLGISCEVGGGVRAVKTIRALLTKALNALPEEG